MGSPVPVVVAEIVMQNVTNVHKNKTDDKFHKHLHLNKLNTSIQFTKDLRTTVRYLF